MKDTHLPPLDLMVPFEAAARLGSFTLAAAELNVTQSAISQRVRALEATLDTALFERTGRSITLTPAGRELLAGVTVALDHLASATASARRPLGAEPVTLATDAVVVATMLMPILAAFRESRAGASIALDISDDAAQCLKADVAIVHGDGVWPGFEIMRLTEDAVFPVCRPDLAERLGLSALGDLAGAPLVDLDRYDRHRMTWAIWLREVGIASLRPVPVLRASAHMAVLDAARAGVGVALARASHVHDDLAAGRLVRPVEAETATGLGYHLALRGGASEGARRLHAHLAERRAVRWGAAP